MNNQFENINNSRIDHSLLESIFEQANIGILLLDSEGAIIEFNPSFTHFILANESYLQKQKLINFIHNDYKVSFEKLIKKVITLNKASSLEVMMVKNNGVINWALINISVNHLENGDINLVTLVEDIENRKNIEIQFEKIHKNLIDIKYAIDQHSIVGITDRNGKIMYVNDKFCEITKYTKKDILGKDHRVLNSGHHPKSFFSNLWRTILSGNVWTNEVMNKNKLGDFYWVHTTIIPILNENHKPIQFISIRTDITDRKQVETNLKRALDQAQKANEIKSEFLANMSHEIRTPMNGIIGMTELALLTELTGEQRDYLEMVRTSANSLLTLLNDILDLSKIEAGKLEFSNTEFSIRSTVYELLKSFELQTQTKGLKLLCQIDAAVPDIIIGDPGRLKQVITNLIGNSIKFTENGEISLTINVYPNPESKNGITLHFAVKDTGIGIAEDKFNVIFESFSQADSSMTRKHGGTGLGLTISRKIIRMMDGEIWLESKENQGSTFHFTVVFEKTISQKPLGYSKQYDNLYGLSILIVDDNNTNRKIVEELLHKWKMTFASIEDSTEALDRINAANDQNEPFDLIILDLHMPDIDGFKLAKSIRENPKWDDTKIILITSSGQRGDSRICEEIGVSAYLIKPFKQYELLDAIDAIIHSKQKEKPLITRHTLKESKISQHILLAEDNPVNQKLAVYILENWGHEVKVAKNGLEVLSLLEQQEFDLILMDVTMPILDGIETTKRIRENEINNNKHIPIIAVTAHAMKGDKEMFISAGMDEYLAKPLDSNELLSIIEKFAGGTEHHFPVRTEKKANTLSISDVVKQYFDNDDFFRQFAVIYEEKLPKQLSELEAVIKNKDYTRVKEIAHDIKGSYSYFQREIITTLCKVIETKALEHKSEGLNQCFKELNKELSKLNTEIKDYLA